MKSFYDDHNADIDFYENDVKYDIEMEHLGNKIDDDVGDDSKVESRKILLFQSLHITFMVKVTFGSMIKTLI